MCNFVPGEAIAIGPAADLGHGGPLDRWRFPGILERSRLLAEDETATSPYADQMIVRLRGIPPGLEVLGVSKLAGALAEMIYQHRGAVDLNHYLPRASPATIAKPAYRLSPTAKLWAARIRDLPRPTPRTTLARPATIPGVAVIDSGLDLEAFPGDRPIESWDFTETATPVKMSRSNDRIGHGTSVAKLLDESLPPGVPLICAKLGDDDHAVTATNLASIYVSLLTRHSPAVVNMSVALKDGRIRCRRCGNDTVAPMFTSTILHHVIRLQPDTLAVMAAGNDGALCAPWHEIVDVPNLVFAMSAGRTPTRATYSSYVDNPQMGVYAFGGDDESDPEGCGVFEGDRQSIGTSFAAPFVSALGYAGRSEFEPADRQSIFGRFAQNAGQGWWPAWCLEHRWLLRP